jgi:hypothetical protein
MATEEEVVRENPIVAATFLFAERLPCGVDY